MLMRRSAALSSSSRRNLFICIRWRCRNRSSFSPYWSRYSHCSDIGKLKNEPGFWLAASGSGRLHLCASPHRHWAPRSEEHTSELQSLMRISYAVFCLKKKKHKNMISLQHSHTTYSLYPNTPHYTYEYIN